MKVKQKPADFVVREVARPRLGGTKDGSYAIYNLTKEGIGTIEAIDVIRRYWNIRRGDISMGGLKDKYARTEQLISVYKGPPQDLTHRLFTLKYSGQTAQSISPDSFQANRFSVCLRDLARAEVNRLQHRLSEVMEFGLPNYFDEQRFGSVRGGNEFPARQLIRGDFEGALKTVLTSTSREDRRATRQLRQIIRNHWGNWTKCFSLLARSSERSIINYLRDHPTNFRQAFELLNPNLVLLYLHAYQSYLWNKGLSRLLVHYLPAPSLIRMPYLLGEFIFYHRLPAEILSDLKSLVIPYITHKTVFPNELTRNIYEGVLQEEGIALSDFRIRRMKKTYFHKGNRAVIVFPEDLAVGEAEADELNPAKLKLRLEFALPRGAYATILIKRLSYDFNGRIKSHHH